MAAVLLAASFEVSVNADSVSSRTRTHEEPGFRVSVVVPTRNRPTHAAHCAASILATHGFVDLIVIDQSDDRATEDALAKIDDRRLRYVRTETRGVTTGRNLGIDLSASEIIAFTDDDCRVKSDWVERVIDVFAGDLDVAVVCGRVRVPEDIQYLGLAVEFEPRVREWQSHYPPLGSDWGITANLSIRRAVLERVGTFDPMLGAGAPLRSGGEPDFLFRVLRAGFKVVNAREVVVDHIGIRKPGSESKNLILDYGSGTGAALFKHVRLGDPVGTLVYLRFLGATLFHVCTNIISGKRPTGAGFLTAFLSGTLASYRFRVDRQRRQYVMR
jgi:glycosyltransferase involved in cell wall biosynthesis